MPDTNALRTELIRLANLTSDPDALRRALNALQPGVHLADQAAAAILERDLTAQWTEHEQTDPRTQAAQRDFRRACERLAALIPAVLGRPFHPQDALLRQVHHNGWTAGVIIDGFTFLPPTYVNPSPHATHLEVLTWTPTRWSPDSYRAINAPGDLHQYLTDRPPPRDLHLQPPPW